MQTKELDTKTTPGVYGLSFFNNKIGYKSIPKIASTSLKKAFYFAENDKEIKNPHLYYRYKITSIEQCSFKFLVIREPIKRFISAYNNKILQGKRLSKNFLSKKDPTFLKHFPEIQLNPNIHQLIKQFDIYRQAWAVGHHTDSIYDLIQGKIELFDKVYTTGQIEILAKDITKIINKPFRVPRLNTSDIQNAITLKDLTQEEIDFLIDLYKEDYKTFNNFYKIDDIWREWKNEV
jgi:hypothetical protein